mgnify:CR=1 FL=1
MDFVPPPNRDDFKDEKEYEVALQKWKKEFEKAKKLIIKDKQLFL